MGTCHIQQQSIFRMILILSGLLMVINNMIINPHKFLHKRLLLICVLTTGHSRIKLPYNLETISKIVLNGRSAWLVVIHIKHLAKIHRSTIGAPIPNYIEHNSIGVILSLDIFIQPHLTQYINGLNTKTFTNTMGNAIPTCYIGNTNDIPGMGYVMPLLE
uniref:AC5 n=1 Tax=Clerodendrum golden mosaic China virus TaxID=559878 RepID=H9NHG8_9GEMI|nr:AC5 [Clerodendrum golden mosaic China virus]